MGSSAAKPIIYSVKTDAVQKDGETEIRRNPISLKGLLTCPSPDLDNLQKLLLLSFQENAQNNYLGTQVNGKYYYKTYSEVFELSKKLGSLLIKQNMVPEKKEYLDFSLRVAGVMSKNREQWIIVDNACILYNITTVPLYDTLNPEGIQYVLENSSIEVLFCSGDCLKTLEKVKDFKNLKHVITFDNFSNEEEKIAKKQLFQSTANKINLLLWSEVTTNPIDIVDFVPSTPQSCYTFSYTSGTTGNPQAAMLSHENFTSALTGIDKQDIQFLKTDVHLSYLPLPHVMERLVVVAMMYQGACICFYRGDTLQLKDDLAIVRPTIFVSVPRLFGRFYEGIKSNIAKLEGCKASLAKQAENSKLEKVLKTGVPTHGLWDALVFQKTQMALGGRCRYMVTGSAPISGDVINFLKIAMCCPFLQGYGQTQGTGGSFATKASDPTSGHVGGPTTNNQFKLVDVPDMNYFSTDKDDKGNAYPRGEIWIRGPGIFIGYYKDPERTAESLDNEGWLHSGDVGALLPNGALQIIDRKKNIFQLSQGEYVAPEQVENIYQTVPEIAEVFLHGDSLHHYCVAVVIPQQEYVENIALGLQIDTKNYDELLQNNKIQTYILEKVTAQGKKKGLFGYEQPKKIILDSIPLVERGVLTNTFKLQRHIARQVFKNEIEQMYQEDNLNQVVVQIQ